MNTDRKRMALLDILLKANQDDPMLMPLEGIYSGEEVDTFIFTGHDTVTTSVEWACYCIARHVHIQKKLHAELDQLIGGTNRSLTMDDLNKLKYFDCVLKEVLRIYPPVPAIAREFTEDVVIDDYKIPKGTYAFVFIYQIHRDERYFEEPQKFIPERFLAENCEKRHPYAYIPFSAGRRNCIGQKFGMLEFKLIMASLLRNFEMTCNQTIEDISQEIYITLKKEHPIYFDLKLR